MKGNPTPLHSRIRLILTAGFESQSFPGRGGLYFRPMPCGEVGYPDIPRDMDEFGAAGESKGA